MCLGRLAYERWRVSFRGSLDAVTFSRMPRFTSGPMHPLPPTTPTIHKEETEASTMASDDDSSDLSSLSSLSPVPSDDELDAGEDKGTSKDGILKFFSKVSEQAPRSPSPPPRKRSPSPAHEYVLADNPDIAVCCPPCRAAAADCAPSKSRVQPIRRELDRCNREEPMLT